MRKKLRSSAAPQLRAGVRRARRRSRPLPLYLSNCGALRAAARRCLIARGKLCRAVEVVKSMIRQSAVNDDVSKCYWSNHVLSAGRNTGCFVATSWATWPPRRWPIRPRSEHDHAPSSHAHSSRTSRVERGSARVCAAYLHAAMVSARFGLGGWCHSNRVRFPAEPPDSQSGRPLNHPWHLREHILTCLASFL